MLAEYPAGDLRFEGLAAGGAVADEAARLLAAALARWTAAHPTVRVVQLDVQPAIAASGGVQGRFEASALVTYVEPALDGAVAAEAVAAAVVEIHEAQVSQADEAETTGGPA